MGTLSAQRNRSLEVPRRDAKEAGFGGGAVMIQVCQAECGGSELRV